MSTGPDADIICKEYGKAKIYFSDQNKLSSVDYTPEQLEELEGENEELKKELAKLQTDERQRNAQLLELQAQPADADLPTWVPPLYLSPFLSLSRYRGR